MIKLPVVFFLNEKHMGFVKDKNKLRICKWKECQHVKITIDFVIQN